MPTYAYRCQNCGSEFEKIQKFTDKAVSKCPVCGKGPVRRILQPAAIVFKGSGWYATDHRSPSGNGSSKADKSEKGEKNEKGDKSDKAEKSGKPETTETVASKSNGDSKAAKKDAKASTGDD
jgi:putative FmdB family regulatory protein